MEAIRAIAQRPSNAAPTAMQRSSAHGLTLPEEQELAKQALRMKGNYPMQEVTAETAASWREDWTELAIKHGMEVLLDALKLHRASSKFLPCRADIEERISQVLAERRTRRDADAAARIKREHEEWEQQCERDYGADWRTKGEQGTMRELLAEVARRRELRESAKAVQVSTEVSQ